LTKIVLIGAGSAQFGTDMLCDLFAARDELEGSAIVLVDINPEALEIMVQVARRLNEATGQPFLIQATTDRVEALPDAQFVIISIAVKRNELWRQDFQIPLKHGVKHVLGENGGPGGLFHAMRNIPIILDICHDIERLCPEALVLNFTNPEGRICLAVTRYTDLQFVGLCHGIGMAQHAIGQALGLPPDDVDPKAGGLNHFNWILELRHKTTGEDLYPAFKRAIAEQGLEKASIRKHRFSIKLCRYLMETFGYWPLPSDDHVGEYLSYAWEYCGLDGYDFEGADRRAGANWERLRRWAEGEDALDELLGRQSGERAVPIISGVLGNTHQYELAVNVPNEGFIPNLPDWAVVEVPATVDASGVHGVHVGVLPEPIAAMCRTQIAVIDRLVEAGVHGDGNSALQALLLDPVVNSISQAAAILDEMLEVHKDYLPQFGDAARQS
jgi:alpha-galactosidase